MWETIRASRTRLLLAAGLPLAVCIALALHSVDRLARQDVRNALLEGRIQEVQGRLGEVADLDSLRSGFLGRKAVYEALMPRHPGEDPVAVLNVVLPRLPDDIPLDSIRLSEQRLEVVALVTSRERAGHLWQRLSELPGLESPGAGGVEAVAMDGDNGFRLRFLVREAAGEGGAP